MAADTPNDLAQWLHAWRKGEEAARNQLMSLVYDELHRLAASYLRRERTGHTLQPTALVHEAYLQLIDESQVSWERRAHFFGAAARLMRRILVDYARAHKAEKRGGGAECLELNEAIGVPERKDINLLALDDALGELARIDPSRARLSSCATSAASPSKRLPRFLVSLLPPSSANGVWPKFGCTDKSVEMPKLRLQTFI
jgi:RNA polymerase sigma-70 factor, ECF subfamily